MKLNTKLLLVLIVTALLGCTGAVKESTPKYVFLFIGDGMGLSQVFTTQVYADSILNDTSRMKFTDFPVVSLAKTFAATRYITGSAAAGTALSTGTKTSIGTLGLSANYTDTLYSIAKRFKDNGKKVAIITSVSINHATPAAFYAHVSSRGSYYNIGKQLFSTGYNFFGSGGFLQITNPEDSSAQSLLEYGKEKGYSFATSLAEVDSLKNIGIDEIVYSATNSASESSLQYDIDKGDNDITLAQITRKAIETVYNPTGFFMMVEGGKIDWACHANDAATTVHEVLAFSDAVNEAIAFYKKHPKETLIIVTADHATGGLSLGNKDNHYDLHLKLLQNQKVSEEKLSREIYTYKEQNPHASFSQVLKLISSETGLNASGESTLTPNELEQLTLAYKKVFCGSNNIGKSRYLYSDTDELASSAISMVDKKAGIGWTSTAHTGEPVPVFAIGVGADLFDTMLDNTDIPKKILRVTGLK
ncbi:MAG: alkaline phosphatase [Bacteroidales bacterium]|nr:alkaline phosphatase [Bacteroidales bacterium]